MEGKEKKFFGVLGLGVFLVSIDWLDVRERGALEKGMNVSYWKWI